MVQEKRYYPVVGVSRVTIIGTEAGLEVPWADNDS